MNLDNTTQLLGITIFSFAALICFWTWCRRRGVWGWLSGLYLILAADVVTGGRHILSEGLRDMVRGSAFYETRTGLPAVVISALLLCVLLFACWQMIRRITNRSTLLAVLSSLFILFLFTSEVVSLHAIDALLYRAAGPVYAIGWAWLAGGAVTTAAAYCTTRRVK